MAGPKLGQPGPYMVCRECKKPVNAYSIPDGEGEMRLERWLHSGEFVAGGELVVLPTFGYDHEAIAVEGDPLSAETKCDFCYSPKPPYVFVPRKPVEMLLFDGEHDFSSPWAACEGCRQLVRKRNMTRLIDRAMTSLHSQVHALPPDQKKAYRVYIRALYDGFFKSSPAGPYLIRIEPKPTPLGRRGSARGV